MNELTLQQRTYLLKIKKTNTDAYTTIPSTIDIILKSGRYNSNIATYINQKLWLRHF